MMQPTCRAGRRKIYGNQRDFEADLVNSARFAGARGVDERDGMTVGRSANDVLLRRVILETIEEQLVERAPEGLVP